MHFTQSEAGTRFIFFLRIVGDSLDRPIHLFGCSEATSRLAGGLGPYPGLDPELRVFPVRVPVLLVMKHGAHGAFARAALELLP